VNISALKFDVANRFDCHLLTLHKRIILFNFSIFPSFSYNSKTDIFALGAIVCEMATGATPTQLDLLPFSCRVTAAADAYARWQKLSKKLRNFITSCLALV
jgi:serine/threonine protein kinase